MKAFRRILMVFMLLTASFGTLTSTAVVDEPYYQLPEVHIICDSGDSGWCFKITIALFDLRGCDIADCEWTGHPSDICPGFIVWASNKLANLLGSTVVLKVCKAIF